MSSLRKYTFILGAAGGGDEIRRIDATGPVCHILEAGAGFQISCDSEAPIPAERGLQFRRQFASLIIENLSAAANTVVLLIGDGEVTDYRPQVRQQIASRGLYISGFVVGAAISGATSVLQTAADLTRVELIVTPPVTNVGLIFIASSAGGANLFGIISPGTTYRINYTGAVYAWGGNAADSAQFMATQY